MSKQDEQVNGQTARRPGRAVKFSLGAVTVLVLLGILALMLLFRPPAFMRDGGSAAASSATSEDISQSRYQTYCPERMGLADASAYGDKEFQTSVGNLSSSARYGAFGSVYRATVDPLKSGAFDTIHLTNGEAAGKDSIKTAEGQADKSAQIIESGLLYAKSGSGTIGATASWATEGDLQGLAAAPCQAPALQHTFLLSKTTSGVTQELILTNPSSKATRLTLSARGTDKAGPVSLATGDTVSVPAHGEKSVDLSAAAPGQEALLVEVSSEQTAVAAVVRTVTMDGLNPRGSDFVMPLGTRLKSGIIPAVAQGDGLQLALAPSQDTDISLDWINAEGSTPAKEVHLPAGKVSVIDLGQVPQGANALSVQSKHALWAQAKLSLKGEEDKVDYAFAQPYRAHGAHSAIALPAQTRALLTVVNPTDTDDSATLTAYDAAGKQLKQEPVSLHAHSSMSIKAEDLDSQAAFLSLEGTDHLLWSARLSQSDLDEAKVPGIAVLEPSALEPQKVQVKGSFQQNLIR
ncbi:hypothetical protein CRD60_02785 [Bifidobacterium aemilianum]|uniref:Organic solvents resistance ABC transporter permease n=1 Tax=Bifidobacterium aemilianum TaxID=2493120 RepID=A0A366K8V9_9BIFI|nr:DUF5719 family protein [Bifidobacterium aemilianum]RBP98104.1 hypothetical protein CRD60_02785 [Bifidobacterium aemilianum]